MYTVGAVGTAEMARILDTTPEKIRAMVNAGEVPYIPIGRVFKFNPPAVFEALERKRQVAQTTGRSNRARNARRKVF